MLSHKLPACSGSHVAWTAMFEAGYVSDCTRTRGSDSIHDQGISV